MKNFVLIILISRLMAASLMTADAQVPLRDGLLRYEHGNSGIIDELSTWEPTSSDLESDLVEFPQTTGYAAETKDLNAGWHTDPMPVLPDYMLFEETCGTGIQQCHTSWPANGYLFTSFKL